MQLSVEEIIAKVAVQRQKQKQAAMQKDLISQINLNSQKALKFQTTKNKSAICRKSTKRSSEKNKILQKKYESLQSVFKKLKQKLAQQLNTQKKHEQIMEKLSTVIKQNKKLQVQLDCLRMKKSVVEEETKNLSRNSSNRVLSKRKLVERGIKGSQKEKYTLNKSKDSQKNSWSCCQCRAPSIENNIAQRKTSNDQKTDRMNTHTLRAEDEKRSGSQQSLSKQSELTSQISLYQLMISQKEKSVLKLKYLVEKQELLIASYSQDQKVTNIDGLKQKTNLELKPDPSQRKVEGTIIKVKTRLQPPLLKAARGIRPNTLSLAQQLWNESNGVYQDQKTKKKPQLSTGQGGVIRKTKRYQKNQSDHSRLNDSGQNFPQQIQIQRQSQFYSPSSSINQTSEFICD